jgi:hypothetical protein
MPTGQLSAISRLKRCATGKYGGICHETNGEGDASVLTKSTRMDTIHGSLVLSLEGKRRKDN